MLLEHHISKAVVANGFQVLVVDRSTLADERAVIAGSFVERIQMIA